MYLFFVAHSSISNVNFLHDVVKFYQQEIRIKSNLVKTRKSLISAFLVSKPNYQAPISEILQQIFLESTNPAHPQTLSKFRLF
uniref:Uncharacterized protein n=1 Tax=Kalanchoe fedtschenkoi TaxID=63787 RepID=A0A7N0V538_KALFE